MNLFQNLTRAALGLALLCFSRAADAQAEPRAGSLREQNNISGNTGLLHSSAPGSGAAGTFRLSVLADVYSGSNFLCNAQTPCGASTGDKVDHFGNALGLSLTPLRFLEAYASLRSFVNDDDQRSPGLLAVLDNTALGAKVFSPTPIGKIFSVGGDARLDLLSGAGTVGFQAARFRLAALAALDLRGLAKPVPLRLLVNFGYGLDNSGGLVSSIEQKRAAPISRLERFGLGINRVDHMQTGLGVEGSFSVVRPFVEWNAELPVNRQHYTCKTRTLFSGDRCLQLDKNFSAFPSVLSFGARFTPWLDGLTGTLALDVGTSGTSNFIEELAPTLPWDFWFGVGYAFDVVKPPPEKILVREPAPAPVVAPLKPALRARGLVHEKDKPDAIAGAILRYQGRPLTAMASGDDGHFVSDALEPGSYTLEVSADGFKPGECAFTLAEAPFVDVDCPLEALPRAGTVTGRVIDLDSGTPVAGANVELSDALRRSLSLTTDSAGAFRFERVVPGPLTLKAESADYLFHTQNVELHAREDAHPELGLHKRPKVSLVEVGASELKLKQQIHFENDSATILGDSSTLLEQITDVLARTPSITQLEIQGHTDNLGSAEHNKTLSEARASAVLEWLVAHGIDPARLTAHGYGQERPIAPNATPQGRARNRRVQFMLAPH
ncbi:MAG TPA: OmpA family protein [Polyangiaceae bacterium]|nr:OmpA family protein [Polyangiaceae bacterium]